MLRLLMGLVVMMGPLVGMALLFTRRPWPLALLVFAVVVFCGWRLLRPTLRHR